MRGAANGLRLLAGDAEGLLDRRVVRLEFVVAEAASPRSARRRSARVTNATQKSSSPKPRQFRVGVHAATADRRRQVVHFARQQAVAVAVTAPIRPRLEQRVRARAGSGVCAAISSLAKCRRGAIRRVRIDQVVAALLEHHDRPARGGQHLGHCRAARTGPDDHRVAIEVSHDALPSGREQWRRKVDPSASRLRRGCRRTPDRRRSPRTRGGATRQCHRRTAVAGGDPRRTAPATLRSGCARRAASHGPSSSHPPGPPDHAPGAAQMRGGS